MSAVSRAKVLPLRSPFEFMADKIGAAINDYVSSEQEKAEDEVADILQRVKLAFEDKFAELVNSYSKELTEPEYDDLLDL